MEAPRAVGDHVGGDSARALSQCVPDPRSRATFPAARGARADRRDARRVRDRQGALRVGLRATPPPRLGAHSSARHRPSYRARRVHMTARPPSRGANARTDVDRLVRGELRDPHSLLGRHPVEGGTIVRAWRPGAETVRVLVDHDLAAKLERVHEAGLFEGIVEAPLEGYELEVGYADGQTFVQKDPYAFLPTLGELDLHLAGEGRHTRLWEKLGAHPRAIDGVDGVAFAVWAPNARSVRVVGDFNSWDGRLLPMRSLGPSGIWELFVPGVPEGSLYKFEVATAQGNLMLKTDPFAAATEAPPSNASIVYTSHYEFGDKEWLDERAASDAQR